MECSDSTDYGAWYNYVAATAGTIMTSSGEATASICPSGWDLPTESIFGTVFTPLEEYTGEFNPVVGGFYNGSGTRVILDQSGWA